MQAKRVWTRWAIVAFVAGAGIARGQESAAARDAGSIAGDVELVGAVPPRKKLEVTKDQDVCGKDQESDELVVGADKRIADVVVSLADVKGGKKMEPTTVTLDQRGCRYVPHVVLVPAGSTVKILNSDGILHNIHTNSRKNPPINIAQPKFKKEVATQFALPETFAVKCDAHGWMSGVVVVENDAYTTKTDEKGEFALKDVPPGEYTLSLWHEKLGAKAEKVKVEPGRQTRVSLKLSAR